MLQPVSSGKVTTTDVKKHNESLILSEIYAHEAISRVRLAELTKLSRPSVTELTQGLIDRDLVVEIGREEVLDKVGKKPTLLALNPNAYQMVGIVLADTTATGTLADLRMRTIEQQSIKLNNIKATQLVELLIDLIATMAEKADCPLLGIAVGAPGIIDVRTGFIHSSTYFEWENLPLGEILSKHFNLPVYIGNDSNLAAIGEHRFGCGQGVQDLVVIETGDGIGVGILAGGNIVEGSRRAAGEIGHMYFPPLDEVCICGRRGCLETMVSWWGIKRHTQTLIEQYPDSPVAELAQHHALTTQLIKQALERCDPHLQALVDEIATYLGQALVILTHVLNPQMIIITGSILELGEDFFQQVRKTVQERTHPFIFGELQIVANRMDNQSILFGAGAFLLRQELGLWQNVPII